MFSTYSIFGSILIVKIKNKRKRVNWGISNKNKKRILEAGKLLYYKKDDVGDNYKGIKWLVHRPEIDYYFSWWIPAKIEVLNPILNSFNFNPARGRNSIVSKLANIKKDAEKAFKLYTRTRHNRIIKNEPI
jgi:hypothetical protein